MTQKDNDIERAAKPAANVEWDRHDHWSNYNEPEAARVAGHLETRITIALPPALKGGNVTWYALGGVFISRPLAHWLTDRAPYLLAPKYGPNLERTSVAYWVGDMGDELISLLFKNAMSESGLIDEDALWPVPDRPEPAFTEVVQGKGISSLPTSESRYLSEVHELRHARWNWHSYLRTRWPEDPLSTEYGKVRYDEWGVMNCTGLAVREEVLMHMREHHPVVAQLLEAWSEKELFTLLTFLLDENESPVDWQAQVPTFLRPEGT